MDVRLDDRLKSLFDDCLGDVMQGISREWRGRTGDVHVLLSASFGAYICWILSSNSLGAIKQPWADESPTIGGRR